VRAVYGRNDHFCTREEHVLVFAACWRSGLVAVVLIHVFEGLRVFPRMGWGSQHSVGHYLDLLSAILAVTLFSLGYLIHAVNERETQLHQSQRADCET
jgi:hypothetical protein